ncbi:class F sortase [Streptacidiphilus rugosus]|uniref:class F sortase n=1 Tax=Streptacidiphilus rugosus TaxID=405783 RepID=UPI000A023E72|nr:class F sortase [Streptacidiphilus rugosus]
MTQRQDPLRGRPNRTPPRRRSRRQGRAAGLLLLPLLLGAWMMWDGSRTSQPPEPSAAQAFTGPSTAIAPVPAPVPSLKPLPPSPPVRVRIPVIGVDAPVTALGLDATGRLATPDDRNRNLAGWYRGGVTPGQLGTAILDGHVDTWGGPAVFYNLGSLRKGHQVQLLRKDGRTAVFSVDAVEVYAKDRFPSAKVYHAAPDAEIRLITCGGSYTRAGGYNGNVVVYAHLVATR